MEKGSPTAFPSRAIPVFSALLLASTFGWSCSSGKPEPPRTRPEATSSTPAAVLPDTIPDLPPPPPIREVPASVPKSVKVLSEGEEGGSQTSLIEASRLAKAKKKNEGIARPVVSITDDNLKEFSAGGQVFILESGKEAPAIPEAEPSAAAGPADTQLTPPEAVVAPPARAEAAPGPALVAAPSGDEADRELFWRQSVSELRNGLRRSLDDLRRIELESSLLRQQFYSESDPFVRDSEIKPRWDRALDQLSALRKKAKDNHEALTALLDEAKKAGVSAEWLSDGAEGAELTEEDLRLINGTPAKQQ